MVVVVVGVLTVIAWGVNVETVGNAYICYIKGLNFRYSFSLLSHSTEVNVG